VVVRRAVTFKLIISSSAEVHAYATKCNNVTFISWLHIPQQ